MTFIVQGLIVAGVGLALLILLYLFSRRRL